jgi:hypothetical protein
VAKQAGKTLNPDLIKRMALLADSMLKTGVADQEVHAALVKHGLAPESAATVIRTLHRANRERVRKRARRDLLIGGAIILITTLATVLLASNIVVETTGYGLLVTWCAMIIGGVMLGRGLMDRRTLWKLDKDTKDTKS